MHLDATQRPVASPSSPPRPRPIHSLPHSPSALDSRRFDTTVATASHRVITARADREHSGLESDRNRTAPSTSPTHHLAARGRP